MIKRELLNHITWRISQSDNVTLVGPIHIGKTTIARQVAAQWQGEFKFLDLNKAADRQLLKDPNNYLSSHAESLVVLDEIHRSPDIFRVLRGQIDERRRKPENKGRFLVIGSASIEALRQSEENLAGRTSLVELMPLNIREVNRPQLEGSEQKHAAELDRLWLRGGIPASYLSSDSAESLQWRLDYIQECVERHLPQFGLHVNADIMHRFWCMIAKDQGEFLNSQRYARSLGLSSGHTVIRYLDFLRKLLLVRVLPPWKMSASKRLVKSPRLYVRDSGVLHALIDLRTMDDLLSHSVAGKSWEGFVIENLLSAATGKARPYFYSTSAGAQVDLVLEFVPGKIWAISIRLASAPALERGYCNAIKDLKAQRNIIIHKGRISHAMRDGIEALTLIDAMNEVSSEANA